VVFRYRLCRALATLSPRLIYTCNLSGMLSLALSLRPAMATILPALPSVHDRSTVLYSVTHAFTKVTNFRVLVVHVF